MDWALVEGKRWFQSGVLLAKQVMHRSSQGVDVYPGFGDAAILLLWCVPFGTDHRALLAALEDLGDPEVQETDAPVVIEHDVGGLDIAKDNWLGIVTVQVAQHLTYLNGPTHHFCLGQKTLCLCQERFQVFAIHILKNKITAIALTEEVIDLHNARMAERSEDVGFTLEVVLDQGTHLRVSGGVEHLFDGAQARDFGKAHILSFVNRAHSADSLNTQDAIPALEQVAVGQGTLHRFGRLVRRGHILRVHLLEGRCRAWTLRRHLFLALRVAGRMIW